MTGGSHIHPDKYLGVAWRTVRRPERTLCEAGVTIISPKRNLVPRFLMAMQELKRGRNVSYLDRLVAIQDTWIEQILPFPK